MTAFAFIDTADKLTDAGNGQLVLAAVLGIATVVVLITWAKLHPFLGLILGTAVMGLVAGVSPGDVVTSFTKGFGSTTGAVGLLVALGAMIGTLLQDSGGADTIVPDAAAVAAYRAARDSAAGRLRELAAAADLLAVPTPGPGVTDAAQGRSATTPATSGN